MIDPNYLRFRKNVPHNTGSSAQSDVFGSEGTRKMLDLLKDLPLPHRTRVLRLDRYALVEILKGKPVQATVNALPVDTEVVSIGHDWEGRLTAIIASTEFDEVATGSRLPEHPEIVFEDWTPRLAASGVL